MWLLELVLVLLLVVCLAMYLSARRKPRLCELDSFTVVQHLRNKASKKQ